MRQLFSSDKLDTRLISLSVLCQFVVTTREIQLEIPDGKFELVRGKNDLELI